MVRLWLGRRNLNVEEAEGWSEDVGSSQGFQKSISERLLRGVDSLQHGLNSAKG